MNTISNQTSSVVMKYYNKFEPLSKVYARQVFDSYKIGMDFEDLVQEFRLKIYTSIIAFAGKWQRYKETGRYKPIPIELYVKSALNNKKKDLFKAINEAPFNLSVENNGFDYCCHQTLESRINPKEGIAEINGINLVEGLSAAEAKCFIMYIYGFPVKGLQKLFGSKVADVEQLIQNRIKNLRQHYSTLIENNITEYKTYNLEEN